MARDKKLVGEEQYAKAYGAFFFGKERKQFHEDGRTYIIVL
jgi:hypothetical protein